MNIKDEVFLKLIDGIYEKGLKAGREEGQGEIYSYWHEAEMNAQESELNKLKEKYNDD